MSFERTKGSITNLSGGNISADELMDMLVCVTRDVYDENQITNPAALQVKDPSVLLKKMYNLIKMILVVYDGNQEGIAQFSERIRNEYHQSAQLLGQNQTLLAQLLEDIAALEQKRTQLQTVHADVQARRGHLLSVREECDAIAQSIERLNDTALDEMAAKKASMEAELAQRTQRADALSAEHNQLRSDLDALEARFNDVNAALEAVKEQYAALQAQEAAATEEKARLENSIQTVGAALELAISRIGDLPAVSERVNAQYQEIQMQMTVMRNALNSAKNDAFLTENLYAVPGADGGLTVDNYPDLALAGQKINSWDELEQWFAQLQGRIEGLLEVLRETLAALVNKAQSITAKQETK